MSRRTHGFTLIEFLVVIIIISTLGAVLLDRMFFYQEAAEKAAMEQIAGTLRSALHLQIADRLLKGKTSDIAALGQDNPMDWLAEPPANYLGERFGSQAGAVPKGNWYFDLKDKQLVYVVARGTHFAPDKQGLKVVRYQVRLVYGRTAQANLNFADKTEVNGVILALVEPYRWF
ncbi:MAG: type II secretion system protein [Burkholderiales bacterium]|nr:type II secretion system protein [Burkholderiales bacterium]